MAVWTLAKKDLRLLVRDPRAAIQSCGCWNSMMLPVSKCTRTLLLLKESTNSIMSRGLSR